MTTALFVLGTRPEAIKLAPLLLELRAHPGSFRTHLCSTGQQADLLAPVLAAFDLVADTTLQVMQSGQSLAQLSGRLLEGLAPVMEKVKPDVVVVQGDTATTLCGALAACYQRIPVVHVEAGLRTGDWLAPFPEELNRCLVSRLARLHCAPTQLAADELLREGIPADAVVVTGNTGIDALAWVLERLRCGSLQPAVPFPATERKRVVVTLHRREAFGEPLER
ncbi:MAG: UDP-N-acetylglucosamine 2-epimerase (non-hydrolyzing), partial [Bryobacterales bacterium]|nr:UDP-N-acetylglucosamine 2-epimerase (non-hydrolyzing) [Bryobacterales bacterium]